MAERPEPERIANGLGAVDFLNRFRPGGPWLLVAIEPHEKRPIVIAKHCRTEDDVRKFVLRNLEFCNLYFHPNPHVHEEDRKAKREEISAVEWLYTDIDPTDDDDIQAQRVLIKAKLTADRPRAVPHPTIITDSGNGFQAFWKLSTPRTVDLTAKMADEAADPNRWLEEMLGGDNCHNIDRIMRLPFTYNIPDKRKAAKGRKKSIAAPIFIDLEREYELKEFGKPTKVDAAPDELMHVEITVDVGDVQPILDLSALDEWNVSDYYKTVIAQGKGDKPKEKDNSRSAWLFDVVCHLTRQGVPAEVIFSLITDKGWGIAESVVERRRGAREYALKQISKAKQFTADPALAKMNEKHFVIQNIGGRCRVGQMMKDPILNRSVLTFQTFTDFKNAHMNKLSDPDDPKSPPVGAWWLKHPNRRQYETVRFAPERETPGDFNLWRGFTYSPQPGNIDFFLEHMQDNICDRNANAAAYLENWIARMYQHPAEPGYAAIVLRGAQGVGKGFLASAIGKPLGEHYLPIVHDRHLTGNFNSHLQNVLFLFADEAVFARDRRHESPLKALITEPELRIERKGVDIETHPNFLHIMMASNSEHVAPVGAGDRRYFVLDVSDRRREDNAYFAGMTKKLQNGGYEALVHHFRNKDITGFDVRTVPKTAAWAEQVKLTLTHQESWWFQKLNTGRLLRDGDGWPEVASLAELVEDYLNDPLASGSSYRSTETQLAMFLKKMLARDSQRMTFNGSRGSVFNMPDLDTARAIWSKHFGDIGFDEEGGLI